MRFTSDTGDQSILSVTQRRTADDNPALECLYRVGVTASVIDLITLNDETVRLIVKGINGAATDLGFYPRQAINVRKSGKPDLRVRDAAHEAEESR